jgi:hypothetical protein
VATSRRKVRTSPNDIIQDLARSRRLATQQTARLALSRKADLIAGVIGPRSVLTKCDLDLILRRLLIPSTSDLCARVALDDRPGVFSASLLAELLENAAQTTSDPLHGAVIAGLSNIRLSLVLPGQRRRRQRQTPPRVEAGARDPIPFQTAPALESDVYGEASVSYDEGDEAPGRPATQAKSQRRPRRGVPGERYLPGFYDNLDFPLVTGSH